MYVTDAWKAAYNLNMRYYDMITPARACDENPEDIISRITEKLKET